MEMLLETSGYRTICWPRARGAAELIRREQPAVAILDLQLEQPDSGLSILEELREDPATAHIPVIIYSAGHRVFQGKHKALRDNVCEAVDDGSTGHGSSGTGLLCDRSRGGRPCCPGATDD